MNRMKSFSILKKCTKLMNTEICLILKSLEKLLIIYSKLETK